MSLDGQKNVQPGTGCPIDDEPRSLDIPQRVAVHGRPDSPRDQGEEIQAEAQEMIPAPDVFKHEQFSIFLENPINFFQPLDWIGDAAEGAGRGYGIKAAIVKGQVLQIRLLHSERTFIFSRPNPGGLHHAVAEIDGKNVFARREIRKIEPRTRGYK